MEKEKDEISEMVTKGGQRVSKMKKAETRKGRKREKWREIERNERECDKSVNSYKVSYKIYKVQKTTATNKENILIISSHVPKNTSLVSHC